MTIRRSPRYTKSLFEILEYIARDNINASINFKNKLDSMISSLQDFPYKFRKSHYFDDPNIRDMTFKKYTVAYRIKPDEHLIEILRIFNRNKPT